MPHVNAVKKSAALDVVRGIAALEVMLSHIRALFFVDYASIAHPSIPIRLLYAGTGLGHESVVVFFVLSGYLIGSSIIRNRERWSWQRYVIDRSSRLYVVLIPALVLTTFWDTLGINLPSTAQFYAVPVTNLFQAPVASNLNLATFLSNSLFCQEILSGTFGSNGPLWSLSYEAWYYVLFPLLFRGLFVQGSWLARSTMLVVALLGLRFIGMTMAVYFLIWLMGVLIKFLPTIRQSFRRCAYPVSIALTVSALYVSHRGLAGEWGYACIAVSVVFLLWLFKQGENPPRSWFAKGMSDVSGCSYTLYLVHMPLVFFVRALFGEGQKWTPGPYSLGFFALLAIVTLAYARAIAELTEKRTAVVRNTLTDVLLSGHLQSADGALR